MNATAYPGYEYHLNLYDIIANGSEEEKTKALEEQRKYISNYTLPDGMTMEDSRSTARTGILCVCAFIPRPTCLLMRPCYWKSTAAAGLAAVWILTTTAASTWRSIRPVL